MTERIVVQRTVPAPVLVVFDYWTSPEHLQAWFRYGPDWDNTVAEIDCRRGGAYRLGMRSADGTEFSVFGEFIDVEPPNRLVYSWRVASNPDQTTEVTVQFDEHPDGTQVTLTHTHFATPESAQGHQTGWNNCIDALVACVQATNP
ncbi:MAG: SRPBCC domain-containing protein [Pseudomonadota bacterium]